MHFLGVEVDLTDLKSVYALADRLVNGTVGSPDATTAEGKRLPHGSPGTSSYSADVVQDRWALSERPGSTGIARAWGWGLKGVRVPRLDAVILTAGIGGWTGLNWPMAVWTILTNWTESTTWPLYKIARIGATTRKQLRGGNEEGEEEPLLENQETADEPPLGNVFCANVFGHYVLSHQLMPLLSRPAPGAKTGGKVIWTSSMEPMAHHLELDDIQGLDSPHPYESSKRLIDTLTLTAELPSVKRASSSFFDTSDVVVALKEGEEDIQKLPYTKPTLHLIHPGVFVSEIIDLNSFLVALWTLAFYISRWLGSPWQTLDNHCASYSSAFIALHDPEELERIEENGLARYKWGSASDRRGNAKMLKTEVQGWGWNGKVGWEVETGELGRKKDAVKLTKEAKEEFEIQGTNAWTQMEKLRRTWDSVLDVKKN